ncbi:hypothetical protein KP509_06G010100 [Ceratopteris richardii]|nr:hypothetical protein KP509_06G010100 [Ceratopteris richardii]
MSGRRLDLGAMNLRSYHELAGSESSLDQKLAAQHAEIQRLLHENQTFAVTHVALRQELAAAEEEIARLQQARSVSDTEKEQRLNITQVALRQELADSKEEVSRLQDSLDAARAEKDQSLRVATERATHLQLELKELESLKSDLKKLQFERGELIARLEDLSAEVGKIPLKDQEIAYLKREIDELQHKYQQARMEFETQKKLNFEHTQQKQILEKNAFAMTRELERMRADLVNAERRRNAYLSASSSGYLSVSSGQRAAPSIGAYESNYGASKQDIFKLSNSETKSTINTQNYGMEAEASGNHAASGNHPSKAASSTIVDVAGDWSKHATPNGKSFYYNFATGATQWEKPSPPAGTIETISMHQRSLQELQGSATPEPVLQQSQSMPRSASPDHLESALTTQGGGPGVDLLVSGLSEGISDRDLASLFHPYGTIIYSKVIVDAKSETPQIRGIVTMESAKAAEAAAAAVSGMFILGRRIKVDIQMAGLASPARTRALQQAQRELDLGVGPVRHHRAAGPSTRWPY